MPRGFASTPAAGRLGFVLGLLLLATFQAAALDPGRSVDQYLLDTFASEQQLGAKNVTAILETRDGYLWLGTNAGLWRYDGFRFVLFEPANTPALQARIVKALLEGPDGSLWIGVYGGGVVWYHDGSFERFGKEHGLPSLLVSALAPATQGGVWVGTEGGGVARLTDGRVVERLTQEQGLGRDEVRTLLVGREGELWIGTERGGLSRWREGKLETWPENKKGGLPGETVMDLHENEDGSLWIATTGGLARFYPRENRWQVFTTTNGLPTDYLFSLGVDRHGNLWIGTGGSGVSRYTGGRFTSLSPSAGLPDSYVWAIHEDRSGGLWLGTEKGLARLRDGLLTFWGERQGLAADQVRGLLEDRTGVLQIAGERGLNRFDNGKVTVVGKAQGLPLDYVWSLLEARDGSLWVSTDGDGVARLKDGKVEVYSEKHGLGDSMVWSLAETPDGAIWAGTQNGGLSRFAAGKWTTFTRRDGLKADSIRALLVDHTGTLWIGTMGGGLSRLEDSKITTYTTENGLGGDAVISLYEDHQHNLWVGSTSGGLSLFKDGRLVSFDRRRGFVTDAIGSMVEDNYGYFWFTGGTALHRVRQKDLVALFSAGDEAQPAELEVDTFRHDQGFIASAGTGFTPAVWKRRDGQLLFSTSRGMAVVDPRRVELPSQPAAPIVETLLANHEPTALKPSPVLPAGTLAVEIHYTAPSLAAPKQTRFRYQLEGYDRGWVEVGERRVAYYPRLPPGSFTFRVAAAGADGKWVEGQVLTFRLLPFFYQTWWFKLLLGALGIWGFYGLYRLRAGRLEARAAVAEERIRMSREMHDTIAQDLLSILMKTRIAQSAARKRSETPDPHLQAIADLAAGSLAETRRLLQALRPPALDQKDLAQALRELAGSLAAGREVTIEVHTQGDGTLAPAVEAELFRIAKEALGNALRYSGAERIEVELITSGSEVTLTVRDHGRGFDPEQTTAGFGLVGMRERAESLGGKLTIESNTHPPGNTGTTLTARVPIRGRETSAP